jgi:hypothetical protein
MAFKSAVSEKAAAKTVDFNGHGLALLPIEEIPPTTVALLLRNNNLKTMPDDTHQLVPDLQLLNVSNNPFGSLPSVFWKFALLLEAYAQHNLLGIFEPPPGLTPAWSPRLRLCDVRNNGLAAVPQCLRGCVALQELFLGFNRIDETDSVRYVSEPINPCPLRHLDLSNNSVTVRLDPSFPPSPAFSTPPSHRLPHDSSGAVRVRPAPAQPGLSQPGEQRAERPAPQAGALHSDQDPHDPGMYPLSKPSSSR